MDTIAKNFYGQANYSTTLWIYLKIADARSTSINIKANS